jgi:hypothetical protein
LSVSNHARFASDEIQSLFAANGIRDLEDAFRVGTPVGEQHQRRATRHINKLVVRLDLKSAEGATPVYIKRQWRRARMWPRPTDIRHRINLQCSPVHEWRGLNILRTAGFNVSEPLAVFWSGWGLSRGAVVTRAVPPQLSMADLVLSGDLEKWPTKPRQSLLNAAVDLIIRMQNLRLSWRSMKAKHFYPEEQRDGSWRIWLIDCEGVYRWATEHDRQREWQTFLKCFAANAPSLYAALVDAYERTAKTGATQRKIA